MDVFYSWIANCILYIKIFSVKDIASTDTISWIFAACPAQFISRLPVAVFGKNA